MKPEEYQKVKAVFQAVLEIEAPRRAAFINENCQDNDGLRREVERLLKNYDSGFLEEPAVPDFAGLVVGDSLEAGAKIGRYEILQRLGRGGMGEVYLARDKSLGREAAIKILLPEFTSDAERVKRFKLEAKAASALNHPNIITIYEISEEENRFFIAAEHIQGETLRGLIEGKKLNLGASIRIAKQIASALVAAHRAGIIHRDIKPENVMVREDGFVKVLDFGLAKSALDSLGTETGSLVTTKEGIVMGSVGYMSPEQARGLEVDARTDLWSLGAVFYEMLTGEPPFQATTVTDALANIIHKEPLPLAEIVTDAPTELYRIVKKSLRKDADERYQTAKDLSLDLKNLRREMELEHELEIVVSPSRLQAVRSRSNDALPTDPARRKDTDEVEETATKSSEVITFTSDEAGNLKKPATEEMSKSSSNNGLVTAKLRPPAALFDRYRKSVVAAVIFLATVVIVFGVYRAMRTMSEGRSPAMKLTRLTRIGNVWRAAISPDGKYVAYVARETDKQSLWVRQVATDGNVQIVPPAQGIYWGLTFSPDGSHIYFAKAESGSKPSIYQITVLGGPVKKLIETVNAPFAVSPDGKQFAFVRDSVEQKTSILILANADGSGERVLATRRAPEFFLTQQDGITWSPDGKTIACHAGGTDGGGYYRNVVAVQVEDGTEKPITSKRWKWIGGLAWLADGSGLFLSASDHPAGWDALQIWQIAYPDGEARQITNDLNGYFGMKLTADAATILTVHETSFSNMWIVPSAVGGQGKALSGGDSDGRNGLTWTPDGRIVYTSKASGGNDLHIWIMDSDGSNRKALTTGSGVREEPSVSADGRYIVFSARPPNDLSANIWRIDIGGGNPKQLTRGGHDVRPQFSPDGKWVIYTHRITPTMPTLRKVSIEGGEPVQLHGEFTFGNAVSPDGMLIACGYRGQKSNGQNKIALLPVSGGPPVKLFDFPPGISPYGHIQWTPDGKSLTASSPRTTKIWMQPLDGSPAKELIDFQSDSVWRFAWSPNGSQLAVARGSTVSDVALISNFR